jgi:conjugative transposon TraM protein
MQAINGSPAFIKKRNFLLILPVLSLPFLIILFFILGGGKSKTTLFSGQKQSGLNLQLPDAHFDKKKEPDKLGLYEASNKDSMKRRMALKNDPYRVDSLKEEAPGLGKPDVLKNILDKTSERFPGQDLNKLNAPLNNNQPSANKEKELMDRLNKLKELIDKPSMPKSEATNKEAMTPEYQPAERTPNLPRNMESSNETDPEMNQLNSMLDKVMAIQHPERLTDSIQQVSLKHRENSFSVKSEEENSIGNDHHDFYGLSDVLSITSQPVNTISAIIPSSQTLVAGSTVRLELTQDIFIQDVRIPRNHFVYGIARLNNERLQIEIHSIANQGNIFPVTLTVYDLDGLEGIFVPGSITRDASKQASDQAITSLGLESLDRSIGAQAAGAGIQAAKSLLSKKIKLVRVTVKSGYQVLIKDNSKH